MLLLLAILPPLLYAIYMYRRDRWDKEPFSMILKSFFIGWLIVIPILVVDIALEKWIGFGASSVHKNSLMGSIVMAFGFAAFVEEGFKYLAFKRLIWNSKYFDEHYDGILYATLIALGFACLENIGYVLNGGVAAGWARAFTAVPGHGFDGIAMGYFFSIARFKTRFPTRYLLLAFLVPFLLHGVYDFLVIEASRDGQKEIVAAVLFGLFLIFMIWLLRSSLSRIRLTQAMDDSKRNT